MAFITATLARQEDSVHMLGRARRHRLAGCSPGLVSLRTSHHLGFFSNDLDLLVCCAAAARIRVPRGHRGERAAINNSYWHIATEPYGPEGQYGALLTYALVLLPRYGSPGRRLAENARNAGRVVSSDPGGATPPPRNFREPASQPSQLS